MLNDIVKAISIKLNSIFGDSHEIYTENVKQGLQEPCFFIKPLKSINTTLLRKRAKRSYPIVISYFPEEGNEEMIQIGDMLMEQLEYVTLQNGDVIRGHSLDCEIVDDVLHASVTYIVFVNDFTAEDSFEQLAVSVGTKGVKNGNR